jgi:hypothetical protein
MGNFALLDPDPRSTYLIESGSNSEYPDPKHSFYWLQLGGRRGGRATPAGPAAAAPAAAHRAQPEGAAATPHPTPGLPPGHPGQ